MAIDGDRLVSQLLAQQVTELAEDRDKKLRLLEWLIKRGEVK